MLMPARILVPTDFSEHSDRALQQALDIARQYQAKVFLIHVIAVIRPEFESALRWEAEERLKNQLDRFPRGRNIDVATGVRTGIVYEEILKESEEERIDLIVIASLGQSGIAKYLVGGVARNVLKGSKCPVLLTK
jgi:nucleotide-binding universal stress UspA family protein